MTAWCVVMGTDDSTWCRGGAVPRANLSVKQRNSIFFTLKIDQNVVNECSVLIIKV